MDCERAASGDVAMIVESPEEADGPAVIQAAKDAVVIEDVKVK
jgi:hypothetical protein